MAQQHPLTDRIGPYRAALSAWCDSSDLRAWLEGIAFHLLSPGVVRLTAGRNRISVVEATVGGRRRRLAVKAFGTSPLAGVAASLRGSKALRTWRAAEHLARHTLGTPAPVACLERWRGGALVESYYLSVFEEGVSTFKHELIRLYRHEPDCGKLMALLQCVASGVRRLHDGGFQHNDLGNQNILLRRTGPQTWSDVLVVDVNRARVRRALSQRQRARDLSRINLPSDFLRVFIEMVTHPAVPSRALLRWERFYRWRYAVHCRTRAWRHPLRSRPRAEPLDSTYPDERAIWIWDERSAQAISTLTSRDRRRRHPLAGHLDQVLAAAAAAGSVRRHYRAALSAAYGGQVAMAGRMRVAIQADAATLEREQALVESLGRPPVHVRFYHHEEPALRAARLAAVRALHTRGWNVSAALVQDRRAVLEPACWRQFVLETCAGLDGVAAWIEAGHATNRVKWGLWSAADYGRLLAPVAEAAGRHPALRFTGPAAIDFEYPFAAAALRHVPKGLRFWALSHHLYVDRRGAPENRQGAFATLEKLALGRALARASSACDERFIVSEVNWPLQGTGVYSPVGSPYESPGPRANDPSVSEADYAAFMVRYLLTATCSGLADEVVWWRLAAHGYGLVDDADPSAWRPREAFHALRTLLGAIGAATFVRRIEPATWSGPDHACLLEFLAGAQTVVVGWSVGGTCSCHPTRRPEQAFDLCGAPLPTGKPGTSIELSGRPVFLVLPPAL